MDIIFIDPGYGKGMTTNGNISCVESEEYNPDNSVAFTGNDCRVVLPFANFGAFPTDAVYASSLYDGGFSYSVKLSVYCKNMTNNNFYIGVNFDNADSSLNASSRAIGVNLGAGGCNVVGTFLSQGTSALINDVSDGLYNIAISTYSRYGWTSASSRTVSYKV